MTQTPFFKETDLGGRLTPFKGVWPTVPNSSLIMHGAQVVGDVVLGDHVSIWHNAVVRGDVNHIRVGERTNVQDGTVIHVSTNTHPTLIGKDVLIAHKCMLHGCTLEDHAFVGMGSIVMDGCVVESDGMLAAGAMLTPGKKVKAGELWAGWPAKLRRTLSDEEIAKNRWMAGHYHKLALQHRFDAAGAVNPEPYPGDKERYQN